MGKATNRLSMLRRSNNRTTARPPSPQDVSEPSTSEGEEAKKREMRDLWSVTGLKLFLVPHRRDTGWQVSAVTVFNLLVAIRSATGD